MNAPAVPKELNYSNVRNGWKAVIRAFQANRSLLLRFQPDYSPSRNMRSTILFIATMLFVPGPSASAESLSPSAIRDLSEAFDLVRDRARVPRTEGQIARNASNELRSMVDPSRSESVQSVATKTDFLKQVEAAHLSDALQMTENDILSRLIVAMIRTTGDEGGVYSMTSDGRWDSGTDDEAVSSSEVGHQLVDGIHYIRLRLLDDSSTQTLRTILDHGAGNGRVIIDLRGSPGGLLDSAITVADMFIATGEIGREGMGRDPFDDSIFFAHPGDAGEQASVVVLIDHETARGAELIAAALKQSGRATLVGEPTAGNGLIQSVVELRSQKRAVKLPTLLLMAGDKKPFSGNPVQPDLVVSTDNGSVDAAIAAARAIFARQN